MPDVPGANFLEVGWRREEGIDLTLSEQVHWLQLRIRNPADVLGGIKTDQAGHDGEQRPVWAILINVHAHGPALQVAEGADLIFAEDLEAPEMQAAQDHDRCTGIHPQDETRREAPAEIYFAMRNHVRINFRVGGIGPAYKGFCYVHVVDFYKALGA